MKAGIHPKYTEIKAVCSCGNIIMTRSTVGRDISIEVCSKCHPFYTGKQKIVDTAGRVDRFLQKYGMQSEAQASNVELAFSSDSESSETLAKEPTREKSKSKIESKTKLESKPKSKSDSVSKNVSEKSEKTKSKAEKAK